MLQAWEVIGEAAKRMSPEVQERFPVFPRARFNGMCNIIAHAYPGIRLSRVFETATAFIPELAERLPG